MSIISCPKCSKKIPRLAAMCSHCGFELGEVTEEQIFQFQQRKARDRVYRFSMFSYVALTVLVAAFGWYWWQTGGLAQPATDGPLFVMGIGVLAYLVARGFLFVARHRLRELQRRRG